MAARNRHIFRCSVLLAVAGVLMAALSCKAEEASTEYRVKAAFLFNLLKFVQWPDGTFASDDAPYVIGLLGTDPFSGALDQAVAGRKIGNRRVEIKRFASIDQIGPCQLLFVAGYDDDANIRAIKKIGTRPVLSVGENEVFCSNGGAVGFFAEGTKLRFAINTDTTDAAKLKLSSKLLKLAKVYKK